MPLDLGLQALVPPDELYHGTARRFLAPTRNDRLHPMGRQQVHLSADVATAEAVGRRHGAPCVLRVAAGRMYSDGFVFFRSLNGVWLTDEVPASYLAEMP